MADWRQIQGRIRRAKLSKDPSAKLAELFQKTSDAMVAFELGRLCEKSGQNEDAVRWYTIAAERFRRAQWRSKAEEALARLGAAAPVGPVAEEPPTPEALAEPAVETPGVEAPALAVDMAKVEQAEAAPAQKRRRRGRRGGRRHRRRTARPEHGARTDVATRAKETTAETIVEPRRVGAPPALLPREVRGPEQPIEREPSLAAAAGLVRGRAVEPALASRLALLEAQLRRLLASPLFRLDQAEEAPASPGVVLLSDSDQTTNYHVEACQTLRIGVGNLLRGERGSRRSGGGSLKARFAEHLGISEARVSKYLKEHCAVRWLQLDEDAPVLAHFAIAVLRPVLND